MLPLTQSPPGPSSDNNAAADAFCAQHHTTVNITRSLARDEHVRYETMSLNIKDTAKRLPLMNVCVGEGRRGVGYVTYAQPGSEIFISSALQHSSIRAANNVVIK